MSLNNRKWGLLVLCISCVLLVLSIKFLEQKESQTIIEATYLESTYCPDSDEEEVVYNNIPVEIETEVIEPEIPIEPIPDPEPEPEPEHVIEPEPEPEINPYDNMNRIDNVKVTYYCAEQYRHICNAGPPYTTARGNEVIPYYTCAVDRNVIPLGSTVYVDYGDGVMHEYYADDTGGAIKGNRIDVAVATHDEAMNCGVRYATVYWEK